MQVTFVFSGYFYVLTYVVIVESVLISSVHISQKRYWFCFVLSHALNRGFEIFFCCFFLLSSRTPPHFTGGVNHTLYNFIYVQYVINNNNNNNGHLNFRSLHVMVTGLMLSFKENQRHLFTLRLVMRFSIHV